MDAFPTYKIVVRAIAFIPSAKEYAEELHQLYKAARQMFPRYEFRIGLVTKADIAKHFKEKKGPQWFEENTINSLVLLRVSKGEKPDFKVFQYNISRKTQGFFQWINDQSLDHVMELSGYSYKIIKMMNKPFFVAYLEDPVKGNNAKSVELYNILLKLAPRYPKFEFTFTASEFYKKKKQNLGVTWEQEPSLTFNFGPKPDQNIPFPQDIEITEENVKEY
jgi:hypothetical protein